MKPAWLLKIGIPVAILGIGAGTAAYFLSGRELPIDESVGGISGIIVDGITGKPLEDAHITATGPLGSFEASSTSSGKFSLDLEDGTYELVPEHEGYASRGRSEKVRKITVQDGTRFVNAKIRMWPTAAVTGRIVTGNIGIQGKVTFTYERDASGAESYVYATLDTDESGHFQLSDTYAGIMDISVAADGFANLELRDIMIKNGQTIDLGDIPLRDGVSLFGQITDSATHHGISNASIVLKNRTDILERTTTDSDGNFRALPLDTKQVIVEISADGYHPVRYPLRLSGNTNREFNTELRRAWGLRLDIQNQTGREPLRTHVIITDVTTNKVVYDEVLKNGKFSLDSLKGGPFLIEAESADRLTQVTVRTASGEDAVIRLKPLPRILVKAKESDGSDMLKGEYRYGFRPTNSGDEDFTPWAEIAGPDFELNDLPEGYYRVELRKGGTRTVTSPEFALHNGDVRHLVVQMTEGGVLMGHVVSSVEGYNLHATVMIEGDSRTVQTDRDGNFVFDKLPTDPVTVLIRPNREEEETSFPGILVKENETLEREFRVNAPNTEQRRKRREEYRKQVETARENGELPPAPPWGGENGRRHGRSHRGNGENGGPPPWANGENGERPAPPWANGENGERPAPPWANGENGERPAPPWANGENGDRPQQTWDGDDSPRRRNRSGDNYYQDSDQGDDSADGSRRRRRPRNE
ncbi:MAG: carboxypeptidase regulatory-like domain-containing protein [Proteobacteria bacterium]|nr:carboxypeptidase regulatory-like domain-containing protein [Pseudomonadota bacterium]